MKVLVVCRENFCRSPILAALLRRNLTNIGRTDVEVESCGIMERQSSAPPSQNMRQMLSDLDIDLSGHSSRPMSRVNLGAFDLIYCMDQLQVTALKTECEEVAGKVRVVNADDGGVQDPYLRDMDTYRLCAELLVKAADRIAREINATR